MVKYAYNIIYTIIGLATPLLSQSFATLITETDKSEKPTPKEMLGRFYKGQALKLAIFTICCLCSMMLAKESSNMVLFGVICGIIIQKTTVNRRKQHESHVNYTN
ncbi:MAG: hypothetical protein VX737_01650 [Pseudomonadota bacterium]|nr:hypothetical protein [Pseudomonadota bacterium]